MKEKKRKISLQNAVTCFNREFEKLGAIKKLSKYFLALKIKQICFRPNFELHCPSQMFQIVN